MIRWLALGLLGVALVACNDSVSQFVFEAQIVDGDDGNPVAGTDADNLRIGIAEGDLPIQDLDFPIVDGQFEALLEFASFSSITRVRVDMEGPTTSLISAPPAFVPNATFGFMKLVATEPSSCALVSFNAMQAPRAELGMVQSGTFALLAGGTSSSDEQVEFLDALEWESRLFTEDFSVSFLGPTRAATVGEGQILVLPSEAGPFVFDMLDTTNRVTQVVLHVGAGPRSALVSVPGAGAMVIGGESGGVARAGVSLVQPGAEVASLELSKARSGPVAAALEGDVLVVGGDLEGTAEVLLSGSSSGQPIAGVMDGPRAGGLLVGDGESRALLLGGEAGGGVREDTLRFEGCPADCSATVGPSWSSARLRAIVPERSALVVGGEDSRLVEEVRWSDQDVAIEQVVELTVPRASPGAIVYESGAFVVGGGDDGGGARDDFEFCVPAALEPL